MEPYTRNIYLGGEIAWHHLDEPVVQVQSDVSEIVEFKDRDEELHNLYLYGTPTEQLGVKAEFVYDRYTSEMRIGTDFADLPDEVETFTVPMAPSYFAKSGAFARVGGTFVNQHVQRSDIADWVMR